MFSKGFLNYRGCHIASLTAKAAIAGTTLAILGMTASAASASTITGSFSSPPASANTYNNSNVTPINISNGSAAWVYYGYNVVGAYTGVPSYTDPSNAASFSTVSDNLNPLSATGGYMSLTASDAPGANTHFAFGQNISFTTNLIAPSETLTVDLLSWNSACNISATLPDGGSFTATDVVLPYSPPGDGDGTGSAHGYGILTLGITGGNVGDTLTFSDTYNSAGVTSSSNGNVGVQAVGVVATPEPATLGLVSIGGLGLLLLKRRRAV